MDKAYLVQIFDTYASSHGEWENECVCLTLDLAKAEQAKLSKRGYKTHVTSIKLVKE